VPGAAAERTESRWVDRRTWLTLITMTADLDSNWSPAHHPEAIAVSEGQWAVWTVDLCVRRIREGRDPERQIDARQLAVALRQVLTAAVMAQKVVADLDPAAHAALGVAIERFRQQVPAVEVRDVLIHFEDYALGLGYRQKQIAKVAGPAEAARQSWGGGYDPATDQFNLGTHRIDVEAARNEAHRLFDATYLAAKAVDAAQADDAHQAQIG